MQVSKPAGRLNNCCFHFKNSHMTKLKRRKSILCKFGNK
uniref:Uncharacterized protein n=1 Tax=Arundo donax TaxID=35708 RepID=A0A0A9EKI5_ARUDO